MSLNNSDNTISFSDLIQKTETHLSKKVYYTKSDIFQVSIFAVNVKSKLCFF